MYRRMGLAMLIGFAVGCGASTTAPTDASTADSSTEPKPAPKEELSTAKEKLAKLEKDIAAKEKELAVLKAEADALRKQIAVTEKKDGKVHRSPSELFADMPKDAYPKAGNDGAPERAACNKWLKENVVGRMIEWKATVGPGAVKFDQYRQGADRFNVQIAPAQLAALNYPDPITQGDAAGLVFGDTITIGPEKAVVLLDRNMGEGRSDRHNPLRYDGIGADAMKKARDAQGKKTTFRARVLTADVIHSNPLLHVPSEAGKTDDDLGETPRRHQGLVFRLTITPPTLNGFHLTSEK